jgi:2-dehydro-3-deoxygalactonokinase
MSGLIGIDWGTSSLRAYRMDEHGRILDTRVRPWGVRQLPVGGFDAALADVVQDWPDLPRLACGMVGSRNGWHEVPYLPLPLGAAELGAALTECRGADGKPLYIVCGLSNPLGPDVMRGEETQLFGALARMPNLAACSTWLLPGTHSKWASVRHGKVIDFATVMTGELFALLRQHSILATDVGSAVPDTEAFARGVIAARDSGAAGGWSRLFSARALMLGGALAPESVPDYLSGLLLGEEFRSALAEQRFALDQPVQLIGEEALCARYRHAASYFNITLAEPQIDAAAYGLWQIALSRGLIASSTSPVAADLP